MNNSVLCKPLNYDPLMNIKRRNLQEIRFTCNTQQRHPAEVNLLILPLISIKVSRCGYTNTHTA